MKTMRKKIISCLLAFAMVFGMLQGAGVRAKADPGTQARVDLEAYVCGENLIIIPTVSASEETPTSAPSGGTITYKYSVLNTEDVDAEVEEIALTEGEEASDPWITMASGQSATEKFLWPIPDTLKGKTISIICTYTGDNYYPDSDGECPYVTLSAPDINGIPKVTRNGNTYSVSLSANRATVMGEEVYYYYYSITPYTNSGYNKADISDFVSKINACRESEESYKETYSGFGEIAYDEQSAMSCTIDIDGSKFTEGFYVLQIAVAEYWGNISEIYVSDPFRTPITFTAADIEASCDAGLVYKGENLAPKVTLTAKDNSDEVRKAETTAWLEKVNAEINNSETPDPLTFAFLRTNEWDGTPTVNVASGPAITLAGTYEIYATGTYGGDTIKSESLGTVSVARDKATPSVTLRSKVSVLDKKADLTVELKGVDTYSTPTEGTIEYLYSEDNGEKWTSIVDKQTISATYTWYVPDNLKSTKVMLKAIYSGDDEYYTAESEALTVDFSLTEQYNSEDLFASIDNNIECVYTGEDYASKIVLSVISEDAARKTSIDTWLKDAIKNNQLKFSFKKVKDGNNNNITTPVTTEKIIDAGTYTVYVSDKRASNLIENESMGIIVVEKADQEVPDADPVITATASEDRLSYNLKVDISGAGNLEGKTVEYSIDGDNYGDVNTYTVSKQEGTQETVSFRVRFAATENYNESEAVTAEFKADVSNKPQMTEGTEFEGAFTVTIAANSIEDEIYYTLDGTTPSLNGDMAYGAFITTIDKTTTVSAMVVGKDKFLGPVATATYTKKAEEKNPSPSPADNPSPTPADEPSGIPTQDPSTNNEEKTIVITSSSETNKLLVAETESETINLMAVLKASGLDNRAILWSVSTPGIVSLDTYYSKSEEAINVTAKKVGTVKITAMAEADRSIKDDIEITVENKHNHAYTVNFNWTSVTNNVANTVVKATATCSVGGETVPVTDLTLTNKMVGTTIEYTASAKDPDGKIYYSYKNVDKKGVVREGRAGQVLSGDFAIFGLEEEYPYTGKKITPDFYVKDGDVVLAKGSDYSVKYLNNKGVGEATIEISGKGNYKDKNAVAKFKIYDPVQRAKDEGVTLAAGVKSIDKIQGSFVYNGKAQYPATITVNLNTKPKSSITLTHEGDGVYTNEGTETVVISVVNNVNKGTAVVAAVGADGKVKSKTFSIKAAEISSAKVIEGLEAAYSSKGAIPEGLEVTWKDGDEEEVVLIPKQDFTVKYSNNKAVGTGKIKLTGKGNFKGKLESSFAIKALDTYEIAAIEAFDKVKAGKLKVTVLDKQGFKVPDKKLSVTVLNEEGTAIDGKTKLAAGTKITVVVKSADPASVVIAEDGISKDAVVGTKMGSVKVNAKKLTKTYTGEAIELTAEDMGSVIVTYKKTALVYGEDFVIIGYANNVNKGSMTVTIAGTGEDNERGVFTGTKTFKVKIVPKSFQ